MLLGPGSGEEGNWGTAEGWTRKAQPHTRSLILLAERLGARTPAQYL